MNVIGTLLTVILLGGLLGMLGQSVRVIGGLSKVHDTAGQEGKEFTEIFQTSRLMISLLIGFTAGALAVLAFNDIDAAFSAANRQQSILALLAAGYAGTDFIESFAAKYLPAPKSANDGKTPPAADNNSANDVPAVG